MLDRGELRFQFLLAPGVDTAALTRAMQDFDAICPTVTDAINAAVLGTPGARVKLIGNFGVGYNHIDIEAARKAGITVTNTPDVLTDTTADLAILLMLMATRRAGEGERELREGRWTGWRPTHLMGQSVTGKTLGVIGFGRIAQATAHRAHHGFGMQIAYYGRRRAPADGGAGEHGAWHRGRRGCARRGTRIEADRRGGPGRLRA